MLLPQCSGGNRLFSAYPDYISIMKKLFALFIASLPFIVQAQTTEIQPIPLKPSKWKLGLCFSPDYANRTLRASDNDTIAQWIMSSRNERELGKFGYTLGLDARYQLNKHIALILGLQYSNKGYGTKRLQYAPEPFNPTNNYIASGRTVHSHTYLDLPLMVNVTAINRGKLSLTAGAGLTSSILLSVTAKSYVTYADGSKKSSRTTDHITDYKTIMFAATVNLAAEYELSSKSMIRIAPTYRHGLNSIVNAPINGYLWSYGLNVGYYRSL
jgi:hypothetical protein